MRRSLALALALSLAAAAAAADDFATALRAEIDALRQAHGLAAVEHDAALDAVAGRRVEAMARDGWFGLVSPAGERIEEALDAAGYPFRLVAEKLVRTTATPRELGDEWGLKPESLRRSVLLADVGRLGIGVASIGDERIVDVVLADLSGPPISSPGGAETIDDEAAPAALATALDERRRAARRSSLRLDSTLAEAARQHAEAVAAALARGDGPGSVEPFGDRLAEVERARGAGGAGQAAGGSRIWQRETSTMARATRYGEGALSVGLVADVADPEEAIEILLASPDAPDLLDPGLRRLGVGLARGDAASGGRIVWVIAATRR